MELAHGLSLQIELGGQALPFGPAILFDFLHISCSTQIGQPMLHLVMVDQVGWIAENFALQDGSKIKVISSVPGSEVQTQFFRVTSYKQENVSVGIQYSIDGYMDAPLFWLGSSDVAIEGTATEALKQIATTCNLQFSGPSTTDRRTWIPRNLPYHEWARQIADEAFRSTSSCMQMGVDFDGGLILDDLEETRQPAGSFVLGSYGQGANTYPATSYKPVIRSGLLNAYSGYNDVYIEQNPFRTRPFVIHENVQLGAADGEMQVNSDIQAQVRRGRHTFSPINPGNVESGVLRGRYQNRRITNMYSTGLEVLTPSATPFRLLDVVSITGDTSVAPHIQQYTGPYRIVSRALYIKGMNRFEKFLLARKTLNTRTPKANSYSTQGAPLFVEGDF